MNHPYTIQQFNISGEDIPQGVADKIIRFHMEPVWDIALEMGAYPSQNSSYRSETWEKSKGRSGNSQHTFKGKGATDWTCDNFLQNKEEFLGLLIENTDYIRFAVYSNFIHCDYKDTHNGERLVFDSDSSSKWTFRKFV